MAFGGSSEFRLIAGDAIGLGAGYNSALTTGFGAGGGQIFLRMSSDESTDFQGITGYFTGIGQAPYGSLTRTVGGGSTFNIGAQLGDVVIHVESTAGARPGRVTLHSVLASTANFSTGTYKSTGGWDITLSNSSTQ